MKQYHDLLQLILDKGTWKDAARENMPRTKALFGHQMRFDLSKGFPMVNTKNVSFKNIVVELLWFLKGDTNIKYLVDNGCNIWNEDAYNYYCKIHKGYPLVNFETFLKNIKEGDGWMELRAHLLEDYLWGDCGAQYGWLWRDLVTLNQRGDAISIDQVKNVIKSLKTSPEGRRHILTAWNPGTLDDMALNACHALTQFNCRKLTFEEKWDKFITSTGGPDETKNVDFKEFELFDKITPQYYLDCQLYQRSADSLLGVPYNVASYALLTLMLCKILNYEPGDFIHTFGDVHIYENHIEAIKEQLARSVDKFELPTLTIGQNVANDLRKYDFDEVLKLMVPSDFKLENYQHYPKLENDTSLSTGLKK